MSNLEFVYKYFNSLDVKELYDIYLLRTNVFVVEQKCAYPEVDEIDLKCGHLMLRNANGKLVAYARLIPEQQQTVRIGRVVIDPDERKNGYGRKLMLQALETSKQEFSSSKTFVLSSQEYAQPLYRSVGFKKCSDAYLEDGIPHVEMRLEL